MSMQRVQTLRDQEKQAAKPSKLYFDPYKHINWKKAQELFQQPIPKEVGDAWRLSVKDVLLILAYLGTETAIDLLDIPRHIAQSTHPGLIDPEYETWIRKQRVNKLIKQLEKQHDIATETFPRGRVTVKITKRGMRRALTYNLDTLRLSVPKTWDGKWRVVMFDIPVRYGRIRDIFRMRLRQLGLFLLQESVYVSPYPCFDEVEFLRELYGVSFTVRYLLVERIEDDAQLRKFYQLS